MADREVTFKSESERTHLPEWASQGAVVLEDLRARGQLAELGERLRVYREGGYTGLDVFVFFALYFAAGTVEGVRSFDRRARRFRADLAAVAGRDRLPSPSSISRFLAAVQPEAVTACASWLLLDAPDARTVLRHPSVQTRDALGQGWHVFDMDPTVTSLRRRALPSCADTPEGLRRSEHTAAPGYPGRKRGQVQFERSAVQHAGSGLWVDLYLAPGNGDFRAGTASALDAVARTCVEANAPLERALLRVDGEGGHVPFITACQDAGVHYLTRIAHYALLKRPEIRAHLDRAQWHRVVDSGSGPERQAEDLGIVLLEAAAATERDDGTAYPPVEARVVVSRFPVGAHERGAGHTVDGWRYELYATSLEAPAWPAAEITRTYYGRTVIENRLAQEDRELGLDHVFSFHLPGQALASLFGLFTWNYQICRGMELLEPPADRVPPQALASAEVAEPPDGPMGWTAEAEVAAGESEPESQPERETEPEPEPDSAAAEPAAADTAAAALPLDSLTPQAARAEHDAMLAELGWDARFADQPGWSWDATGPGIRCPNDELLTLNHVEMLPQTRARVRFQPRRETCLDCPKRAACLPFATSSKDKRISRKLSPHKAQRLRALRAIAHIGRKPRLIAPQAKPRDNTPPHQPSPRHLWDPPPPATACGRFAVTTAALLPSVLRTHFRAICQQVETRVERHTLPRPKPIPAYSTSDARRQHRRLTWTQRNRYNELPPNTPLRITFSNAAPLAALYRPASHMLSQPCE